MRTLLPFLLLASACGSTWSDRDLEFASALPSRAELRSKLPTSGSSSSPLTGTPSRRDPLNVGDPSKAYADAKGAATIFNGILDYLLTVLDHVRTIAPTSRTDDSRTWGPYADQKNQGFEFTITVFQRSADTFDWLMKATEVATHTDLNILQGTFKATSTAKKGRGAMHVTVNEFREKLSVDANFKQLDDITIGYITDQFPIQVAMAFTFKQGVSSGISTIGYTYLEHEDHSGALDYEVRSSSTDTTVLETAAIWTTKGEGHSHSVVKEGRYTGATLDECWDTSFNVTYYAEGWTGGQTNGTVTRCPVPP